MELLEDRIQIVVADRGGQLRRGAEEVLAHEGGEADGGRVNVGDGEEERGACGVGTRVRHATKRKVELDRVELQLLEVPHPLRRAVAQELAPRGLDVRALPKLLVLGPQVLHHALQKDGELQHLRGDHEVEHGLKERRLDGDIELEKAARDVFVPIDGAARLSRVHVDDRGHVDGGLLRRDGDLGEREHGGERRVALLVVHLEGDELRLEGGGSFRLHEVARELAA